MKQTSKVSLPESTYSLGDLFIDLAARNRKDRYAALRRDTTYAECWKAICNILDSAIDKQSPVILPGLGSVHYRVFNLGICIPYFQIDERFAEKSGLSVDRKKHLWANGAKSSPTIKINKVLGGEHAGVDSEVFGHAYKRMVDRVGEVLRGGSSVTLDFGVGTFVCENGTSNFEFLHRLEARKKPMPASTISLPLKYSNTSTSMLSHIPETSRRIKFEHAPKPPSTSSRRLGIAPGGGRQLTNPSESKAVSLKMSNLLSPVFVEDGGEKTQTRDSCFVIDVSPNKTFGEGSYPPLLDGFARTRCAVVEDILYSRNVVDRIGGHYTTSARSVGFDSNRGLIVVRKTDSRAPEATDGFTNMLLSPRACDKSVNGTNFRQASLENYSNSNGNRDQVFGLSNSRILEDTSAWEGNASIFAVREVMEVKKLIWKSILKVAKSKARALKEEVFNLSLQTNHSETNSMLVYLKSMPEHQEGYFKINDISASNLQGLLKAHLRSGTCRHVMWESLAEEAANRCRYSPSKKRELSLESERAQWNEALKTMLATVNECVVSSCSGIMLEELEHFRHETLFALQVAVSLVSKKIVRQGRGTNNPPQISSTESGLCNRKSKTLRKLEKLSKVREFEVLGLTTAIKSFLDWVNFDLDDMREELAERLSNHDANSMNDGDQSTLGKQSRAIHAAQRKLDAEAVQLVNAKITNSKSKRSVLGKNKSEQKSESDEDVSSSLRRFVHYINSGVPDEDIPPIPEFTFSNILTLSHTSSTDESFNQESNIESQLEKLFVEVKTEYRRSLRRCILQYVLKSTFEQHRLKIFSLPAYIMIPEYGWGAHRSLPFDPSPWHEEYTKSRSLLENNLFTTAPQMVEVLSLWEEVRTRYLVCLPINDENAQTSGWRPMAIEEFYKAQSQKVEDVRRNIMDVWMPKVVDIFLEADANGMFVNVPDQTLTRFFDSVATLMATKARELVIDSLKRFLQFFERFDLTAPRTNYAYASKKTISQSCALKLDVILDHPDGEYESDDEEDLYEKPTVARRDSLLRFRTALSDIRAKILILYDSIARSLNSMVRVEKRLGSLAVRSNMQLLSIDLSDDDVAAMRERLCAILDSTLTPVSSIFQSYEPFVFVINERARLKQYFEKSRSLEDLASKISKYRETRALMISNLSEYTYTSMILLSTNVLNKQLVDLAETLAQRVLSYVSRETVKESLEIKEDFKKVVEKINKRSGNSHQLVDIESFIKKLKKEVIPAKMKSIRAVKDKVDFLYGFAFDVTDTVLVPAGVIFEWGRNIRQDVKSASTNVEEDRKALEAKFNNERNNFVDQVQELHNDVSNLHKQGGFVDTRTGAIKNAGDMHAKVVDYENRVSKYETICEQINDEEERLGFSASSFPTLEEAKEILDPYFQLWSIASRFQMSYGKWMKGPVFHLNYENVVKVSDEIFRSSRKLSRLLKEDSEKCSKLSNEIFEKISAFKNNFDLLSAICNPGLRDRHWTAMSSICGFTIVSDDHTSLSKLLDQGILEHVKDLMVCAESATKESSIEKNLATMREEWNGVSFECKPYKNTGAYIVTGTSVDEVQILLDDQIMKTQTMSSSQFAKPFCKEMKEWETFLLYLESLLEAWLACQSTWLYLEPIFTSDDIKRQMPEESDQFAVVDGAWRLTMNQIIETPDALDVYNISGLLQRLQEANVMLDTIQKGLSDYLMVKRIHFPRFFFLSDDELLEILAETKDPNKVQPFLKKCFDGLNSIEFSDSGDIIAMGSAEGEKVALTNSISPAEAKGSVEVWLLQLEDSMRASVKAVMKKGIEAYMTGERMDFVQAWPGQVVLAVTGLYWTRNFEEILLEHGSEGLSGFTDTLTGYIDDIVDMVRGKVAKLLRKTLSALIIMDVHARDTVALLRDQKVEKANNFGWQSQLRYYWEDSTVHVKMIVSDLEYGYEYLGNSGRLVITPLTDRCYRTLMGAIHLQYGGAPEGPAGTGKTETTKDLSKALARQCVVYNCSDGLDYLAMAKFFKGLASAGAWACFDEFNRIVLEVLSVVAQQITTIQQAVAARKTSFVFYGTELTLKWTCNVFITMNPGYAGRAELPDNLKSLFRTVAMMVPDYAMIAEIILYSFGFRNSRDLATKIVTTFTLCSEQLSSQSHYDYGMRAVMSVLRAAGNLKQAFPGDSEDIVALRAINDVNKAKFLSQDLTLFAGITSDLFPGVILPNPDYSDLMEAVNSNIDSENLQRHPEFLEKIIQTYEMMVVRHGFMIVGKSLGGKSACLNILAKSLGDLCDARKMPCALNSDHELKVEVTNINPKSISMDRLYGYFDAVTHEWSDGVLPIYYRAFASSTKVTRKWILFDGPVDAIWIENMNTVLDDNKKLCLMTGEMLQMNDTMSMIFENLNLDAASPATVSRCGMVYMEPDNIGLEPRLNSWMNTLPDFISKAEGFRIIIDQMFGWLVPPCIDFVFRLQNAKPMVPMERTMMINTAMSLAASLMDEFDVNKEGNVVEALNQKQVGGWLESIIIFSIVWAFGGVMDGSGRQKFDAYFRAIVNGDNSEFPRVRKILTPLPRQSTVFDIVWDKLGVGKWSLWEDRMEKQFQIPDKSRVSELVIPTVDTIRYTFLLDIAIQHKQDVLFVGPTGTGKTIYINAKIMKALDRNKFKVISLGFSAQTTSDTTQNIIDGKLDKRRKNVYGPPPTKQGIIFIDDLNMPMVEQYGAQPPLELIRQAMSSGGWYDSKTNAFRQIVDTMFVSAMGPPGGGRNNITPRIVSRYHVFGMTPLSSSVMERIFGTIMEWHMNNGYDPVLKAAAWPIVKATSHIYESAMMNLLPTPSKSHYIFNLRDFSRVVFGMTMVGPKEMGKEKQKITRLWIHEVLRVFSDRLVNNNDRLQLLNMARASADKYLSSATGGNFDACCKIYDLNRDGKVNTVEEARQIIYGNFMNAQSANKLYDEVPVDAEGVMSVMTNYLEEYNALSTKPMNLVMFMFAVEHCSRISRVIMNPGGHALLVGVGGSGRQSLTRLAAFIGDYELTQIEIAKGYGVHEFRSDFKQVMIKAGGEGKRSVFLLSDTQVTDETFIEDMATLLNTGDVPNIFAADELGTIMELVRKAAAKEKLKIESPEDFYSYFVDRVKRNMHVVLAFSPIGDAFRERLRKFPSLVNCCTINWFTKWPDDALLATANSFLQDSKLESSEKTLAVEMCMHFHSSTVLVSALFLKQLKRHYHVTPTSYLSLITTFKDMLMWKYNVVSSSKSRYEVGLQKIETTESSVAVMQKELEELQPELVKTAAETADMMIIVEKETADAQVIREKVAADEAKAAENAKATQAIKEECEEDLAEAMPILEKALKALNTLSKNDIVEVKSMKSPPAGVLLTMEAVCIMMDVKPAKSRDEKGKIQWDYWEPAKKDLLGDSRFLQRLIEYDKDNITSKIMEKVTPFVSKPEFMPDIVKKASVAAHGLCCWVRAMVSYDRVAKVVKPKKIALKAAEEDLEIVMAGLRKKQAELKAVEDKLDALDQELKRMERKKEELEHQARLCVEKIDRAEKLLGGLGGEKTRWEQYAIDLGVQLTRVCGDMLIASAFVAYSGAFTSSFRHMITMNWLEKMDSLCIPYTIEGEKGYSLVSTIGDPVKIRAWNINSLPVDSFSVENGLIMSRSSRWPLMIDPQGQANKWIRNLEKSSQLKVIKTSESGYLRVLESAIQFGQPVLLENIGESLDASLEPLLLRQIFKSGGVSCIRIGDKTVEYSEKFRFFMTTLLSNPHYLPETSVKVTIINFMITSEGLQDQLLGIVVAKEKPELEEQKNQLILEGAENKRKLKEIEDKILHILTSSKGNILEDSAAIDILTVSKTISNEITAKQKVAEQTETRIDSAREVYVPVAVRSTVLFFVVSSLAVVEPMYQYSLGWFTSLFVTSIANSEQKKNIRERIQTLNDYFTYAIYRNVCQSLFEKDKLLFSFLLTSRIVKNLHDSIESINLQKAKKKAEAEARARREVNALSAENNDIATTDNQNSVVSPVEPNVSGTKESGNGYSQYKFKIPASFRGELVARITDSEEQFLLAGAVAGLGDDSVENPCPEWLEASRWRDICYFSGILQSSGTEESLSGTFGELGKQWKTMYDDLNPEKTQPPGIWGEILTPFQLLCILRCIRPDRLVPAMTHFVASFRGEKYTEPPPFDLAATFKDSNNLTPLIFILSPGTDPIGSISTFAATSSRRLDSLSLGQGQGPIAERMIKEAMIEGSWVVLQNCHLFPSWMPRLDEIVETMQPDLTHESFRLWLTSYPSSDFPVAVLRNGVKLTNEPPKGIRANLLSSFNMEPISKPDFFEGCVQAKSFKKMVFALSFFHAIVQERVEFGPIGWNIPYEFTASDLIISVRQLRFFLDDLDTGDKVPFEALRYIIGQCNYGGRVTDDKDRRAITSILENYFNPSVLRDATKFSPSGLYYAPAEGPRSSYLEYIQSLPLRAAPEVFGLHENANIAKDEQETSKTLSTLLLIRATTGTTASDDSTGGAEVSQEDTIYMVAENTVKKMKPLYDMYHASQKYPIRWDNSMNTVLVQELERFNKLNTVLTESLNNVMKAVKGVIVMSSQLEEVAEGLQFNRVPSLWLKNSYPSLMAMGSYVADFLKRLEFFEAWILTGCPPTFWISGFYFTQAFLTGTMQNYARKHTIPIDALKYDFEPLPCAYTDYNVGPDEGAFVYGLFFDGAKWDFEEETVTYAEPKKLFSQAPVVWLKPILKTVKTDRRVYSCPVYKTSARRGVLSTTGHSTNFVIMIDMPTELSPSTWIQAGVCMLTQLND